MDPRSFAFLTVKTTLGEPLLLRMEQNDMAPSVGKVWKWCGNGRAPSCGNGLLRLCDWGGSCPFSWLLPPRWLSGRTALDELECTFFPPLAFLSVWFHHICMSELIRVVFVEHFTGLTRGALFILLSPPFVGLLLCAGSASWPLALGPGISPRSRSYPQV